MSSHEDFEKLLQLGIENIRQIFRLPVRPPFNMDHSAVYYNISGDDIY